MSPVPRYPKPCAIVVVADSDKPKDDNAPNHFSTANSKPIESLVDNKALASNNAALTACDVEPK